MLCVHSIDGIVDLFMREVKERPSYLAFGPSSPRGFRGSAMKRAMTQEYLTNAVSLSSSTVQVWLLFLSTV